MLFEEKKALVQKWLDNLVYVEESKDLETALYTIGELGLLPDNVDSVSVQQALLLWKVVEHLRKHNFPDELVV